MDKDSFLGLPILGLNLLCTGLSLFIISLGLRVARAPELELKIANNQLIVGDTASKLADLATKLDEQTKIINQKDEAYKQLQKTYEQSIARNREDERLTKAFQKIKQLPKVEGIEQIQEEIIQTEESLIKVINE